MNIYIFSIVCLCSVRQCVCVSVCVVDTVPLPAVSEPPLSPPPPSSETPPSRRPPPACPPPHPAPRGGQEQAALGPVWSLWRTENDTSPPDLLEPAETRSTTTHKNHVVGISLHTDYIPQKHQRWPDMHGTLWRKTNLCDIDDILLEGEQNGSNLYYALKACSF